MLFIKIINTATIQIYLTHDADIRLIQFVMETINQYNLRNDKTQSFTYTGFEIDVWHALVKLSTKASEILLT